MLKDPETGCPIDEFVASIRTTDALYLENRPLRNVLCFVVSIAALFASNGARAEFTPISLGSAATRSLASIDPAFPTGNLTFLGVPFVIPEIGNNVVWNNDGPSTGTIVNDFTVEIAGVTQVQTLLNTTFGQRGPNSYLRLEFLGSAGADYTVSMIGGVDVRDLFNGTWTNTINGTTTVNAYTLPNSQAYRMDKQTIELPPIFESQTLTRIRMIDSGAFDFQRAVLYGITVQSVPEPSSMILMGIGSSAVLLGLVRRRFHRLNDRA